MAYKLIDQESKLTAVDTAVVVFEGDNMEELASFSAKNAAIEEGGKLGLAGCGIAELTSPYPVLRDGKAVETDEDMNRYRQEAVMYGGRTAKFRVTYPLKRSGAVR